MNEQFIDFSNGYAIVYVPALFCNGWNVYNRLSHNTFIKINHPNSWFKSEQDAKNFANTLSPGNN